RATAQARDSAAGREPARAAAPRRGVRGRRHRSCRREGRRARVREGESSPARRGLVLSGHLELRQPCLNDAEMWRREEPALDHRTVDGIIRMLMAINAKLDRLLGEEENDVASEDES